MQDTPHHTHHSRLAEGSLVFFYATVLPDARAKKLCVTKNTVSAKLFVKKKGGETMQTVGKNIRVMRTQQNITQDELAERLFVSRQTVSNYETGRTKPDIDMLMRISEVLEVDVQSLLYGSPTTQARRTEKRRLIISCTMLAVLVILYALIDQRNLSAHPLYMMGLPLLLALVLRPCLFLIAGWTLMQGASLLPKVKLSQYYAKHARRAIVALLIAYFLLILPFCMGALSLDWHAWQHHMSGTGQAFSKSFYLPVVNELGRFIIRHYSILWIAFTSLGALLWLTSGKVKTPDFT